MLKLYYSPGACSLASRISLHEAGIPAHFERVDLKAQATEAGEDFTTVNPKGCVPTLQLDDGRKVTENIAILDLLSTFEPLLGLEGAMGKTRLLEMLSYLSSELHIAFKPFYQSEDEDLRSKARAAVSRRLDFLATQVRELYLFGPHFTVADAYLFAMLRWARDFSIPMQPQLHGYFERVAERPAVRQVLADENLPLPVRFDMEQHIEVIAR